MNDKFNFPDNLNDFIDMFSFKDNKEIYTNGADLIPVFRVKEAISYYFNGVFVKGMKMPENCSHCRFNYDGCCHALQGSFPFLWENKIKCPLIDPLSLMQIKPNNK